MKQQRFELTGIESIRPIIEEHLDVEQLENFELKPVEWKEVATVGAVRSSGMTPIELFACGRCGALVDPDSKPVHETWHDNVNIITMMLQMWSLEHEKAHEELNRNLDNLYEESHSHDS